MARGVNKVILIGHLGKQHDITYLPNGNAVTRFSLATSDTWKDKQTGQQQQRTEWHRVVVFGTLAEVAAQYLGKGSHCYIEGRLQTREWEKDGVRRYSTEIVVDMHGAIRLLGSRSDDQPASARRPPQQRPTPAANQQPVPDYDSFDDDIPFDQPYRQTWRLV